MVAKYLALVAGAIIFSATIVSAQPRAEGYAVAAGGGWISMFHFDASSRTSTGGLFGGAAGVEVLATPRLGVGVEIGALTDLNGGFLVPLSFDGRAHFRDSRRVRAWSPFALAGYTRTILSEGSGNAAHFGMGADYRLNDDRAVRLEVRDVVQSGTFHTEHTWSFRVGVTFRDR